MSFKYNRFFASTCLSLAAASFLIAPDARAGFEWTPPEKKEIPVEIIKPEPVPESTAVPLPNVEEGPITEAEPDITIKVLDDPVDLDTTETVVEETLDDPVIDIVAEETEIIEIVETIEEPEVEELPVLEDEAVSEAVIVEDAVAAEDLDVVEEVVVIEDQAVVESPVETPIQEETVLAEETLPEDPVIPDASEATGSVPEDNSLTLDFNPGNDVDSDNQPVAILPEDAEQDISEVELPDDVSLEAKAVEAPRENIFWAEEEKFDVIEGFGNDLPLALALRQIVPARYAFSFGEGVNAGTKVSWEGGRPWNEALENALAPVGADFSIQRSNLISIKRSEKPVSKEIEEPAPSDQASTEIVDTTPAALSENTDSDIIEVPDVISNDHSDVIEIVDEIEETVADDVVPEDPSPLDEIYKDVEKLEGAVLETDVSDFPDVPDRELESAHSETSEPLADQKKNEPLEQASLEPDQTDLEDSTALDDVAVPDEAILWNEHDQVIGELDEEPVKIIEIVDSEHLQSSDHTLETAERPEPLDIIEVSQEKTDNALVVSSTAIEESVTSLPDIAPAAEDVLGDVIETEEKAVRTYRSQPSESLLIWKAPKGANVKRIIKKWAKQENVELIWHGADNQKVDKDVFISGTFGNAIEILLTTSVDNAPSYQFQDTPEYALIIDGE